MTAHLTPSQDPSLWEELNDLSRQGWDDSALLSKLVELWCKARNLEGAALYVATEAGLQRELTWGSGRYGLFLDPSSPPRGSRCYDLPGGVLLSSPGAASHRADSLDLLLAAVLRARDLSLQLEKRRFQDSYRGVELEALYDVGLAIASTLNLEELSEEILLRAVSLLDARRGALYLLQSDGYLLERTIGGDAAQRVGVEDPQVASLLAGETTRQDVLPGAQHPLAVPIEIDEEPRGLLVVADKESRHGVGPFVDADRRMLSLFANQAAIALENANLHLQALEKERLEREMELAAEIQRGILPTGVPEVAGFELMGWNRPTQHVGGDYYGFIPLKKERLGLVVADVTGKGLPAALLVSTLHSALHLLVDQLELGDQLWSRLNEHIVESSAANKFITLLLVDLHPGDGRLRYLNAGHNPGLLLRRRGEVVELTSNGVPLGLLSGSLYRSQSQKMEPGDLLCLYSDGITECMSPKEDEFGTDRLAEILARQAQRPLGDILGTLDEAVQQFAGGCPQMDDQTVVLLRRV